MHPATSASALSRRPLIRKVARPTLRTAPLLVIGFSGVYAALLLRGILVLTLLPTEPPPLAFRMTPPTVYVQGDHGHVDVDFDALAKRTKDDDHVGAHTTCGGPPEEFDESSAADHDDLVELVRSRVQAVGPDRQLVPNEVRSSISKKFNGAMADCRFLPWFDSGALIGFRIVQSSPHGILQTLGFKNRDIVTHVNGVALANPSAVLEAFHRADDEIVVRVMRDSSSFELRFSSR